MLIIFLNYMQVHGIYSCCCTVIYLSDLKNTTMRSFTLSLCFLFLAHGLCGQLYPIAASAASGSSLLDVVMLPHERNVEVYFSGESRPAKSYLHLKYLTAKKEGHHETNQLVLDLKKQAQAIGADAIIVLRADKVLEQVFSGESYRGVEMAYMDAIAVVYPEHLQFVPGQVKKWTFYQMDSLAQRWQLMDSVNFDFRGKARHALKKTVPHWWYYLSHQHLMEMPDLLARVARDELNRERKRFFKDDRDVRIFYKGERSLIVKELKTSVKGIGEYTILYEYNADGSIASREIYRENWPMVRYYEYPELDEAGNIKAWLYLRKMTEKKEPYLRVAFEEYTEEDWNAHVKNLIAEELGR